MRDSIRQVVVVGGGSAGWLSAARLAAALAARGVKVTLVESPDVPIIGVGEGTWPTMRSTLQAIGLSERDFLRRCDASFKQGTQFCGWVDGDVAQSYLHPFSIPAEYSHTNLAPVWLRHGRRRAFAEFVTPQAAVIDAGLAPKQATTPEYAFNVNYGYHFDAGAFAVMLREHAVASLGVRHVLANVVDIEQTASGDIGALDLDNGERLDGDLFLDCTGQRSLLLGDCLGVAYRDTVDCLFNDAAVAVQVPHADAEAALAPVTRATATDTGWIWDIALPSRRGVGHVYATRYSDADRAEAVLREYAAAIVGAAQANELQYRHIAFSTGLPRIVLEEQLCCGRPVGRICRTAGGVGDRADRAGGEHVVQGLSR